MEPLSEHHFMVPFMYNLLRLPSAVCRLPSAVCRLPSAVCRLPSASTRRSTQTWFWFVKSFLLFFVVLFPPLSILSPCKREEGRTIPHSTYTPTEPFFFVFMDYIPNASENRTHTTPQWAILRSGVAHSKSVIKHTHTTPHHPPQNCCVFYFFL